MQQTLQIGDNANKFPIANDQFPMNFQFSKHKFKNTKTNWRLENEDWRFQHGVSLLEILVVIAIFAILGIITTRAVILTIGGSKKSESLIKVRENLGNSMGIIERQLRNADSVINCDNTEATQIDYTDQVGNPASFTCLGVGTDDAYVASGSARLTSNLIKITYCGFICVPETSTNPASVSVSLNAQDVTQTGVATSKVTMKNQIFLRNY
ncbi:MAG TPA: prepilin-type N-terminal cleavage/methylation domain-containing protein [Patescibacteria group bacterium]|nr:prepilin-type N-terminal cleavage/methylation domain-containing protein [Patescibacteria group bacterium]